MLSLLAVKVDKDKGKSEIQLKIDRFDSFFAILGESQPKSGGTGFTWNYYVPYFYELQKRKYVEPFVYYIGQGESLVQLQVWLEDPKNRARMDEFLDWSKHYVWPRAN